MKGVEVTGIDTKEKKLKLDNGEDLPYEKVVLATGASSFLPPIENLRTANNVIGLRNLDDAIRIKEIAPKVKNIIILGAGLVGVDAMAGLLDYDAKVTMIEMGDRILPLQLDHYAANVYIERLKEEGVDFRFNVRAEKVIVDENNNLTGQVEERWTAYNKGMWRRTVSCWIMNYKGEILLQKRTANKRRNPNKWAKTGGQVDSGESVEEAIKREVKEELGIDIPENQLKVVEIYKGDENGKRFAYNFIFVVNYNIEDYKLQKEEVAEVKYVKIEDIETSKRNNDLNYTFSTWKKTGNILIII